MEEPKVMKNALVTDKAIKEDKNGKQFFVFQVKEKKTDQYPKAMSWFVNDDTEKAAADAVKKGNIVDIDFTEKPGVFNGKQVTYRNIMQIKVVEAVSAGADQSGQPEHATQDTENEERTEAVADSLKTAILVREAWIENFVNDERLKDFPKEALVSIFSTIFIQANRAMGK